MKSVKMKMGGMAAAVTVIVIAAVILINVLAGLLTQRFFLSLDLTPTRQFDLSDETISILSDLPGDAVIYLLLDENEARTLSTDTTYGLKLVELLEKYCALSNGRVTLRFTDPLLNTNLSEQFGVGSVQRADILVQGARRTKHITFADLFSVSEEGQLTGYRFEQVMTSAMLYVMAEIVPEVVFTEGHGEASLTASSSTASVSLLSDMFTKSGFSAASVNLGIQDLPENTAVVVVTVPSTDFADEEIAKLDAFVKRGGVVLYLTATEHNTRLTSWLAEWGLQLEDVIIMDEVERMSNPMFVIPSITDNEVFSSVSASGMPLLQIPRSVRILFGQRSDITTVSLLETSRYSFGRVLGSENTATERAEDDPAGPFTVGAMSSYRLYDSQTGVSTYGRIIVLPYTMSADSSLQLYTYLNNDLTGAVVRYITPSQAASGLIIPSKSLVNRVMTLTGIPGIVISVLLVLILPLGIFATGLILWLRRRRL